MFDITHQTWQDALLALNQQEVLMAHVLSWIRSEWKDSPVYTISQCVTVLLAIAVATIFVATTVMEFRMTPEERAARRETARLASTASFEVEVEKCLPRQKVVGELALTLPCTDKVVAEAINRVLRLHPTHEVGALSSETCGGRAGRGYYTCGHIVVLRLKQ